MLRDARCSDAESLLPAAVRLMLEPEVADALEVVLRRIHDDSLDEGVARLEESLPVAEARAAADDLARCAGRLARIGKYGEHMTLSGRDVDAVAGAGRAARKLSGLVERLRAELEDGAG